MTLRDEFTEILADLQHARFDDTTHQALRSVLTEAAAHTVRTAPAGESINKLADLLLLTFYVGREHAARGYEALTMRDPGGIGQTATNIPDTVAELLAPDLRRFHVEFHADVLARSEAEAISKADGDDWRVREVS